MTHGCCCRYTGTSSLQHRLARVLATRRCFAEALLLMRDACVVYRNQHFNENHGATEEFGLEVLQLLRSHGAMWEGAGRYSEALAVYQSFAADGVWLQRRQQQLLSPFAHRCHALNLLLRAAAACPTFAPRAIRPHMQHLQPPPAHALLPLQQWLALTGQLWRDSDGAADAHALHMQRLQLLCLGGAPAAAAARLAAAASGGGGSRRLRAACIIMRRCFSARGLRALLYTCAHPPEYYPCA